MFAYAPASVIVGYKLSENGRKRKSALGMAGMARCAVPARARRRNESPAMDGGRLVGSGGSARMFPPELSGDKFNGVRDKLVINGGFSGFSAQIESGHQPFGLLPPKAERFLDGRFRGGCPTPKLNQKNGFFGGKGREFWNVATNLSRTPKLAHPYLLDKGTNSINSFAGVPLFLTARRRDISHSIGKKHD